MGLGFFENFSIIFWIYFQIFSIVLISGFHLYMCIDKIQIYLLFVFFIQPDATIIYLGTLKCE